VPWKDVTRTKSSDDTKITDKQSRRITQLQEQLDRVLPGTYSGNRYHLTSREASRYISELEAKIESCNVI